MVFRAIPCPANAAAFLAYKRLPVGHLQNQLPEVALVCLSYEEFVRQNLAETSHYSM